MRVAGPVEWRAVSGVTRIDVHLNETEEVNRGGGVALRCDVQHIQFLCVQCSHVRLMLDQRINGVKILRERGVM